MEDQIIEVTKNYFVEYSAMDELARIIHEDEPSIGAMWERISSEYADFPAISDLDKTYTYAEMNQGVAKLRGALVAAGVKKGAFVGVLIPNSYQTVKAFLATVSLGAVAVMIPPHLDAAVVKGMAAGYRFAALVYGDPSAEKVQPAGELTKLVHADADAQPAPAVPCTKADPCVVLFTGGTTGKSKGALLAHGAMIRGTINGCYGVGNIYRQKFIHVLPLTHVFGLVFNMLNPLYTGSCVRIVRNPKDMFRDMAVFKPTKIILVPALAEMALNLSKQMKAGAALFGGELKQVIVGGSASSPHLFKEFADLGIVMLQGYGLTETANLVSANPRNTGKVTSIGWPYPGESLRIVNGELWVKGDHIMMGYLGAEEENKNAFEDGWFKTGDLVRIDEEGLIYIVGRIKELIVLDSGEKVSPAEVEAAFCTPDYINDAMVYADRNEAGRQFLALEVVLRPGFAVDEETVKAEMSAINATLPGFQRVSKIIVRTEDFPRTPSMKKIRGNRA